MSAVVVDGELVHYEVLGRGRPVILLHGAIGSWRYWVPLLQRLQQSYRLYALDLFGFGDSAKNPTHFTLDKQVELVQSFMDELGVPKAALIGHGLGALVAAEFARRHSDHVARLLLVSTPLFDPGGLDNRVPAIRLAVTAPPAPPPAPPASPPPPVSSGSASAAMRAALAEAARTRGLPLANEGGSAAAPAVVAAPEAPAVVTVAPVEATQPPVANSPRRNELAAVLGHSLETLLGRAVRRSEDLYDKLMVDVAKADGRAALALAAEYDSGALLDSLRLLPMPIVDVHGSDDPVFPPPAEDVLTYLTADAERVFLPILLPGVRHFPMLEDERFYRIAGDFLEAADVSRIEIRERWRRRTR